MDFFEGQEAQPAEAEAGQQEVRGAAGGRAYKPPVQALFAPGAREGPCAPRAAPP